MERRSLEVGLGCGKDMPLYEIMSIIVLVFLTSIICVVLTLYLAVPAMLITSYLR